MAATFSTSLRNAWLTSIGSAAGTSAKLHLMGGTRPATGVGTESPLITFTCNASQFFTTTVAGVGTLASVAAATALAGGASPGTNATWARLRSASGTFVADFDVGITGNTGADLTLDSVAIVSSPAATVTPGTITITAPGA